MEFWVLGFGSLVSCNRSRVMAESTSRAIPMEEAGRKAAIASGIEDVKQAAGAYQLLLACPAGVPASLVLSSSCCCPLSVPQNMKTQVRFAGQIRYIICICGLFGSLPRAGCKHILWLASFSLLKMA